MPFGLKNAGATYQRAIQKIFDDMLHKNVECYVDDLVVKSKTREDHFHDLRKRGIEIEQAKIDARTSKHPRAQKFVRKASISSEVYFKSTRSLSTIQSPLILYVAAQECSIGILLAQKNDEGNENALYHLSRTMTPKELKYSPIEKLCLTLILRCLSDNKKVEAMEETHSGVCDYARRCQACQFHANLIHQPPEPLHPTVASWPLDAWGLDVVGPLTKSSGGHLYILAATDYFSKWAEVVPLKEVKKENVADFSTPTSFTAMECLALCNLLKKVVAKLKRDWHERIGEALSAYKTTVRTPTQTTPYALVYGGRGNPFTRAANPIIKDSHTRMTYQGRKCSNTT
ncbi:UNVERIFIED_CONTAM: hypothetical protein Scaly_2244000 [Sesamum calycinum]|uniref:Reverse transcriptase domain-containing protein n=1 Tax=Sesamum calycinum TaxID=2727403 RepID=A0AAW2M9E6_9LAMI